MSAKKITVQYDEGAAAVYLADGTYAERGKPVSVPVEVGKQLLEQGWHEAKASSKSSKTAETKGSGTNTTTADTPQEDN